MSISDTLNKEAFRGVSTGQFIGIILGGAAALLIMCLMGGSIVGWFLGAALAYVLAHLFHTTHKQKAVLGAVSVVLIILVGAVEVNPSYMDAYRHTELTDSDHFSDVEYVYDPVSKTLTVTAVCNPGELTGKVPVIAYTKVTMICFGGLFTEQTIKYMDKQAFSGAIVFADWNVGDLHYITLAYATEDTSSGTPVYTVDQGTTYSFTDASVYNGDATKICWLGAAYSTAFFALFFFVFLLFSWFFRSRLKKTREKMESEGRLYPQGYGRCEKCGAIVLPGEVECRKCGTYIDRPDSMKPKKVDYFRCTNCGCEVTGKSESCPKCGAVFIEDETAVECPECGTLVPAGADGVRICPRCGKRFQD